MISSSKIASPLVPPSSERRSFLPLFLITSDGLPETALESIYFWLARLYARERAPYLRQHEPKMPNVIEQTFMTH